LELLKRLAGIITLRGAVYRDIALDSEQTDASGAVIVSVYILIGLIDGYIVATANEVGSAMQIVTVGMTGGYQLFTGLFVWVVGGYLNALIASKVFRGNVNIGQMMRIIGYASMFRILGTIPLAGFTLFGIALNMKFLSYLLTLVGSGVGLHASSRIGIVKTIITTITAGAILFFLVRLIKYVVVLLFYTLGIPY
jgi:hypothetical protein